MKRDDLTGRQFGLWTVKGYSGKTDKFGVLLWDSVCRCGTVRSVKANNLRSGTSTNCGCVGRSYKHGMTKTPTFKSWYSMRQRCENPNDPSYARYGGRGIKVCEPWLSFEAFLHDMGIRPDRHTLDRIDNGKGYEPGNCRWASPVEQQANREVTVHLTVGGITKPLREWARVSGISPSTLSSRLAKGWPPDEAVNRPVRPKRPSP